MRHYSTTHTRLLLAICVMALVGLDTAEPGAGASDAQRERAATMAGPQSPGPHFVPADLPRFTGREAEQPFADRRGMRLSEWRLLYASGDAEPELLYQTNRLLLGAAWSPDSRHITALYETHGDPGAAGALLGLVAPEQLLLEFAFLHGLVTFDLRTSPVGVREELLVGGFAYFGLSPDWTYIAMQRSETRDRDAIYIVDRSGQAWRLEGVGDKPSLYGWVPDGSGLLVQAPIDGEDGLTSLYIVPLDGGTPQRFEVAQGPGFILPMAWSPDGQRLAYLISIRGELFVLDRALETSRRLGASRAWRGEDPQWGPHGDVVVVGGDLVDVATGEVMVSPVAPYEAASAALSPDGRYFAVAEDPNDFCGGSSRLPPPCGRNPERSGFLSEDNRVCLHDRQTGETRHVQACGQGLAARVGWLGQGRTLLIWQVRGEYPDDNARSYAIDLLDLETGRRIALTDGQETHADAVVSPDGSAVIVIGERLRIYTAAGDLLREIVPPAGFDVPFAQWSPDGTSFTYILGSAGFFPVYP